MRMGEHVAAAIPPRLLVLLETTKNIWRTALLLIAAATVAACAGPVRTGATLDGLTKTAGGPKAGHSRIVVLRDKDFGKLFDTGWNVYLDGVPMRDLKTGTFVYRDRPAGKHQLFFARGGDFSRGSQHTFAAAPGRTYIFRLAMNEKGKLIETSGYVAGLAGMLVSSAVAAGADQRGLFDFTQLDEASARQVMADIRLAD